MTKDIQSILADWEFKPNNISVRKIKGVDGSTKIQLRLDLGLLQMEIDGRPDGQKPFGFESLLEYYQALLLEYRKKDGSDENFTLDTNDCAELQRECIQYYHRYLSMFQLEEYKRVERDTERNLRVFDLVKKYAAEEKEIWLFEQYRSYVIMMNTRAKIHLSLHANKYKKALAQLSKGIENIRAFFDEYGQSHLADSCREIKFLENWSKEIREKQPLDPIEKLKRQMEKAVEDEDYEKAAVIRDRLKSILRA